MDFEPIGTVRSCFPEKFGIPRQSGLVPAASAVIRLKPDRALRESLRGLAGFSHLWVIFVFHAAGPWKPLVRPPRLGGGRKTGVLATRSPHRPNPIGISVVRVVRVLPGASAGPEIHVSGGDFLDGSPVLDVKPYLPYADSVPRAQADWASRRPKRIPVSFAASARSACRELAARHPGLSRLIRQMVAEDPRPAFQARRPADEAEYSARLLDLDVHWTVKNGRAVVRRLSLPS
jgi:tRNA-Thr(GGU) m(6)t(6)A37 methyltransferase TsaA